MNWHVIRRWYGFMFLAALTLAGVRHFSGYAAYVIASVIACGFVADKLEPRNWTGPLPKRWVCPRCQLSVTTTSPEVLARIREAHSCHV